MPTTYTLVSWAVILAAIGLAFYLNYYKTAQVRRAALSRGTAKTAEKKKEPKKWRKIRKDESQCDVNQESQKEQKPKIVHKHLANNADRGDEDKTIDKEFARQFSSAKSGTSLPRKSPDAARHRSIKQSRAQEKSAAVETSSENGTTGADADDDRSSLNSPELAATTITSQVASSDFSDMLEARAPGPSIIRLTPSANPVVRKPNPAATYEVAETKKQRQNRKKAELKKQAREEEEKQRKFLLEKQRRTAREADGRAAKDGSAFMAPKAPLASAWTAPAPTETHTDTNSHGNKGIDGAQAEFLDTYTTDAPNPREATRFESKFVGSDWQRVMGSISEEEQVRRALEDSDSWKTVSKEKRNKKIQSTQPSKPESNNEENYAPPRLVPPPPPGQAWKMLLVSKTIDGGYEEFETEVQDSEWEVA
jgi:hypothetical protein